MLRARIPHHHRPWSNRALRLERLERRELLCHSAAPVITLSITNTHDSSRDIAGTVHDADSPVAGLTVQFGGVLAGYGITANVAADGTYFLNQELLGLTGGVATAQTHDGRGLASNVATDYILGASVANSVAAAPTISNFSVQNTGGDNWTLSGQVAGDPNGLAGLHVKFGGVLAKYRLAAAVRSDGSFSMNRRISDLCDGQVTAKLDEIPDALSNLATDSILTNDLAPVLSDFRAVNVASDLWTFTGKVADADDSVAGRRVVLGGDLARYHLTTTVRRDGTFSVTKHLRGLTGGTATAQVQDVHAKSSELANCTLASTDAVPVISDFQAIQRDGNTWIFSGRVTDADERMAGRKVVLGGVLAPYNVTATVRRDGTFSVTKRLSGVLDGMVTVQTQDRQGRFSELAVDYIVAQDSPV